MTKEVALDILADDIQKRLYDFIWSSDEIDIDDGSNVRRDFVKAIKNILTEYFGNQNWVWFGSKGEITMIMTEEEMDEQLELMESMKTCDFTRNVTLEEVEKLEYELDRANSEIRDLKELIIKLLFDRYGF